MDKGKLSVIIPSRGEQFMPQTVEDVFAKAKGPIEVWVVLDGYWPTVWPKERANLMYIHRGAPQGMRSAINSGVSVARGEFLLKCDAHCAFDEGFDVKLLADMEDDWVVVPRRKRLDAANWCIQDVGKPDIDYMYLSYPDDPQDFGGPGLNGKVWDSKNKDLTLKEVLIDDIASCQGSAWFMHRDYFYSLELMDEEHYGTFWNECQEIFLKAWLSGGRCVVNKKTWYAHLHKGKTYGRGYHLASEELTKGATFTKNWIYNRAWAKQTRPFSWFVEKFSPMPTWPGDWKEQLYGSDGEPWSK